VIDPHYGLCIRNKNKRMEGKALTIEDIIEIYKERLRPDYTLVVFRKSIASFFEKYVEVFPDYEQDKVKSVTETLRTPTSEKPERLSAEDKAEIHRLFNLLLSKENSDSIKELNNQLREMKLEEKKLEELFFSLGTCSLIRPLSPKGKWKIFTMDKEKFSDSIKDNDNPDLDLTNKIDIYDRPSYTDCVLEPITLNDLNLQKNFEVKFRSR
jgi:hypothetical protein